MDRVSFLGRKLGSAFEVRMISVDPGRTRPYDEAEWRDALVVVECGEIELECVVGGRERFGRGAVLCMDGLPLRVIRNPGPLTAVLVAISRRHPATDESPTDESPDR